MKVQRCQRTPFQVMLHDCELATWADVRVQFRLVVNVYEPHLPSLDDGEPAGGGGGPEVCHAEMF